MKRIKCLTKKAFREWLESKNPRTRVGEAPFPCTVVERFLSTNGVRSWVMSQVIHSEGKTYASPGWVRSFRLKDVGAKRKDEAITAAAALKILDQC